MSYTVIIDGKFRRELEKLDPQIQKRIKGWIFKNLVGCDNTRLKGKPLTADLHGYWRYRVGDYRLLAEINDTELILIFIGVGHRRFKCFC